MPLVLYANHASWWDPLVGLVLTSLLMPGRRLFAPMDAAMCRRYGFFTRLGFFPVEQQARRGVVQFLHQTTRILRDNRSLLAITPQGRFTDVRERPVSFLAGIGHLAANSPRAAFLPVAVEYVFWNQRLPEILIRFGPQRISDPSAEHPRSPEEWRALFESDLACTQDALAEESRLRDPGRFRPLLSGGRGQGGLYDIGSALKARLLGQDFKHDHP